MGACKGNTADAVRTCVGGPARQCPVKLAACGRGVAVCCGAEGACIDCRFGNRSVDREENGITVKSPQDCVRPWPAKPPAAGVPTPAACTTRGGVACNDGEPAPAPTSEAPGGSCRGEDARAAPGATGIVAGGGGAAAAVVVVPPVSNAATPGPVGPVETETVIGPDTDGTSARPGTWMGRLCWGGMAHALGRPPGVLGLPAGATALPARGAAEAVIVADPTGVKLVQLAWCLGAMRTAAATGAAEGADATRLPPPLPFGEVAVPPGGASFTKVGDKARP
jgi:hypothetical protein